MDAALNLKKSAKAIAPFLCGKMTHAEARAKGILKPGSELSKKMEKWSQEDE